MKILVSLRQLEFGGTQVNAIELAAALRDFHGHDVVLFATPGPLAKLVKEKGLRFLPCPDSRGHPSLVRMRALRDAVREQRPDLLHVWDWFQCVDAYYAVHLPMRVPMVVTDMMMDLTRMLPKALPTTFGIPELVDQARAIGRRRVQLILPPVDVKVNAPGAVNPAPFRERFGIEDGDITLVTVSRLTEHMKGESLFRTVDVVRTLGRDLPLRILIAGDGTARPSLERLADNVNTELGRDAVVLSGSLLDPRPAYAAADIVVGMGGSALRGMAFEKPVVIVGEAGFSAPLTPEAAELFFYKGIYGRGGADSSDACLLGDIRGLAENPARRQALGRFAREFVVRHFSLETVSAQLAGICRAAVAEVLPRYVTAIDGIRMAAVYLREKKFLWRWTPSAEVEGG